MESVSDYIDAAKASLNYTADWKLTIDLGVSPTMVHQWKVGKCWPSEQAMIRLAELAGLDPTRALLDLNLWRARDPKVSKIYSSLIQRLGAACVAFALVIVGSSSVQARTITEQTATTSGYTVYYHKSARYRWYRILCTLSAFTVQHLTCGIEARSDAPCFRTRFSPA